MRKMLVLCLLFCCSLGTVLHGQETPEAYRQRAYNKIEVSMQLFQEARSLVERDVTAGNLETAVGLLIRAGQGLEEAGNMLRRLGPGKVREEEIQAVDQALASTIEFINECNQALQAIR